MQKKQTPNAFQHILEERIKTTVEIYYETSVHKKFLADVYAVIPKGRKCVIWFTNKQCWMFQIAKRPYTPGVSGSQRNVVLYDVVRMMNLPFANEAWYAGQGTIIYGTCVSEKRSDVQRRFNVENVHYLCGEKQPDNGALGRFAAFFDAYAKEITSNHPLKFCMPIMHTNFDDAARDAGVITTYDVFCIQHRFMNRACSEFKNLCMNLIEPVDQRAFSFFPKQANAVITQPTQPIQPTQPTQSIQSIAAQTQRPLQTRQFMIRPDAQNDIYYVLRSQDEPITANTMIAHIPNYKTSVMMNALFRNIKENRNLDALEESDDEDETLVPLVDLNKCVKMSCTFSHRFKRWQPVQLQPF